LSTYSTLGRDSKVSTLQAAPVPECDNDDFTVGFWVQNWLDAGATGAGILALQSSDYVHVAENCLVIYRAVGDSKIKVACYDSLHSLKETLDSGVTASSGYMCVRRSGDVVSFFLNGAFVAEATVTDICAFTWLLVGHTSYGYAVADWIDKIRYWDSALSDEEIEYWYAKDKPRWNDSCVLWLRGDEENGSAVKDYSPQGNDGVLTATLNDGAITSATWVIDAEKGKCLSFDGVNDYVDINSVDFGLSTELTVSAEIKTDTSQAVRGFVIKHTADYDWMLYFFGSGFAFYFKDSAGTVETLNTSFIYYDDVFHTFTATFDGSTIKLFVDGVEKASKTSAINNVRNASTNFRVGYGFGGYFKGVIRNVRVYNRGLSGDEVSALHNRTSEVSYGCVGKWLLNEGSGLVAYDSHNRFTAKRGNALNFIADGAYVTVPKIDLSKGFTILTYFQRNGAPSGAGASYGHWIMQSLNGESHGYFYVRNDTKHLYISFYDATSTLLYASKIINSLDTLNFLGAIWDGNNLYAMVNNEYSAATALTSLASSTRDLTIGRHAVNYHYANGLIDEAMIFSRALSATEIKRVYEADGFLDYIPLRIQDGSLVVSVDSVGVQWDSWANGACRRKHLGLGKNVSYTFTAIEETADVPWIDSAAYILKEKKDSGTPIDLYIKKTDVLAAESTSVVIDSMNVRYSPTMQVRYIDFSVREQ